MFERYTDRARRVVVLAEEEARLFQHNYVGTEHLLLGVIHEGEGVAARALTELGVSLEVVRAHIEHIIGHGSTPAVGHLAYTPRAKKVLELSLREALQLGHNYIGTEHVLLGLIREGQGVAAQTLTKLGAELPVVRKTVIKLLSGYQQPTPVRGYAEQLLVHELQVLNSKIAETETELAELRNQRDDVERHLQPPTVCAS